MDGQATNDRDDQENDYECDKHVDLRFGFPDVSPHAPARDGGQYRGGRPHPDMKRAGPHADVETLTSAVVPRRLG